MKKALAIGLSAISYLSFAANSFAGASDSSACPPDAGFLSLCKITGGNIGSVIGAFIEAIFVLAILVALMYLIWGGFKWLTSGGDKTAVGAAREHIVAALVGLVVIFLSYFVLNIIITIFLGNNFSLSNVVFPTIPQFK